MLTVQLSWPEAIFAFRRSFSIPLRHITAAEITPDALSGLWKGIRAPGTHIPGLIVAGTYYKNGEKSFWYIRRGDEIVSLRLTDDENYDQLVLGVEDAQRITHAINHRQPS